MDPLRSLMDAWSRELAQTLEMMAGNPVQISWEPSPTAAGNLWWQNSFSTEPTTTLTIGAEQRTWLPTASGILEAAGIDPVEEHEARSTWLEVLEQAASSTARRLGGSGRTIECSGGREVQSPAGEKFRISISSGGAPLPLFAVVKRESATTLSAVSQATAPTANKPAAPQASRTMEALLDVQLPVAISFGQARLALRDVLKLTTGSVVELNRQPEEPVDIIVNDCVIARGEVVVVDGNYAVRIQSIVGRHQRIGLRPDFGGAL